MLEFLFNKLVGCRPAMLHASLKKVKKYTTDDVLKREFGITNVGNVKGTTDNQV